MGGRAKILRLGDKSKQRKKIEGDRSNQGEIMEAPGDAGKGRPEGGPEGKKKQAQKSN